MKQFTSPVKPQVGHAIKADHMQNHARAIEELQRALQPIKPSKKRMFFKRLPFEVTASDSLQAAPGVFCDTEFDTTIESTPLDGDWYFQGLLVIDDTTGSVVSATVEWSQTEGVDTTTDFYTTIATVYVDNTTPTPPYIVQYNYGTIVGIVHGSTDQVWNVTFF